MRRERNAVKHSYADMMFVIEDAMMIIIMMLLSTVAAAAAATADDDDDDDNVGDQARMESIAVFAQQQSANATSDM